MKTAMILLFVVLDLLAIPALVRFCFGDITGFFKSLYFGVKPDVVSLLDGSLGKDIESEDNSRLFFALLVLLLLIEAWVISGIK